jgi:hypothetical protein
LSIRGCSCRQTAAAEVRHAPTHRRARGCQVQTIILDNEGEFATLREKIDVLLVGDGGELAADVRSAGLLARRLLESRYQRSSICTTWRSMMTIDDATRSSGNFLNDR